MQDVRKALTLHAPWAWAIAHAGKRVENRTWAPPQWMLGRRVAIHAGGNLGDAASRDACRAMVRGAGQQPPAAWPKSQILCTAVVSGHVTEAGLECGGHRLRPGDDAWYVGPVGWLLADVKLVRPVECKGALGLWDLPQGLRLIETGDQRGP